MSHFVCNCYNRPTVGFLTRLDTGVGGKFTPPPGVNLPPQTTFLIAISKPFGMDGRNLVTFLKYVQGTKWRRQNCPITHQKSKMAAPKPEMHGKWLKVDFSNVL